MNKLTSPQLRTHDDVLIALAKAIDIPDHLFEKATSRYEAIGRHLEESSLSQYDPKISPQGSMLLGTVIRPLDDSDEFDIDLVCKLEADKKTFTQQGLKASVGEEIKAYAKANAMQNPPEEGKRCWTLVYSKDDKFHMDILPALPDQSTFRTFLENKGHWHAASQAYLVDHAIAITDQEDKNYETVSEDWPVSNPKGFAIWFSSKHSQEMERRKTLRVNEGVYMKVDDVPDHKVKTPLQRAIQLLKRHRDSMYKGSDDAPISIIITTLAAHSYQGEQSLSAALKTILMNMEDYIENRGREKWVQNPVNPEENFADKWPKHPEREEAFYTWLAAAQRDFGRFMNGPISSPPDLFKSAMTQTTYSKVANRIATVAAAAVATSLKAETEAYEETGRDHQPWVS
ncbi:MAG: cyclic GMP-AMP synthase DncV-like nucleotidyltransferase [Cognatishimia sp.]